MSNAVAAPAAPRIADLVALIEAMEPDTRRILRGVTWDEYHAVNQAFVDPAGLRMSFIEGVLEIIAAGMTHERYKELITALLRTAADELEIDLEAAGLTTLKLDKKQTGAEPDSSFYVQHATQMIGVRDLDLQRDPPPDLVIEVYITHPSYSKQPIYARIGVPEIWRFDGANLVINELINGEYRARDNSLAFPFLQASDLLAFINQSLSDGQTKTLRDFRAWIRAKQLGTQIN